MSNYGPKVRAEIYEEINIPKDARLPISFGGWKSAAKRVLNEGAFDYIESSAGAGYTMLANREAFYRWRILPRVMVGVSERDLSISLLGYKFPFPVFLAPIGRQELFHPRGELATAKAAADIGTVFILSTFSSQSIEEVAAVMGDAPRWFQLYWGKNYNLNLSLIERARKNGYSAVVITVDNPLLGWRPEDLHNLYPPLILRRAVANFITDPVFVAMLPKPPQQDMEAASELVAEISRNPNFSWDDLAFIRKNTRLPILIKGILHPEDALMAINYGANGIIVSNHGGRHLDGAVASLNALPKVYAAVQGRVPVLMDSGIRRGADVIKAIALGASAVLVGRPYAYGLAVAGDKGVKRVMRNLIAETDITMGNSGRRSISEVDRSLVIYSN
ncbi:MAG: lactate 2-monooxygenase [Peptococcaceae bacterium BRH_c8a]|nr:MAG: lactate 2-monooxygenase [Peptococcaceae bacterium BRH_c8a]